MEHYELVFRINPEADMDTVRTFANWILETDAQDEIYTGFSPILVDCYAIRPLDKNDFVSYNDPTAEDYRG